MSVFVLDRRKKPLMPCSERRARLLLASGRARVHRLNPFTIRLTDRTLEESTLQPVRLKIDPGSRVSGVAIVRENPSEPARQHVLHLSELEHRGHRVRQLMARRAAFRLRRRGANLRHRPPRFDNRRRPDGWLPPSLRSRLDNVMGWVARYRRFAPVRSISVERVRFDTQLLQNPEIAGLSYQQGELAGYELREYLLEKWGRRCAYCDADGIPLQIDHVVPRSRGGSDRASNLTLACAACNHAKGAQRIEDFLAAEPERRRRILARAKAPLADAAAVNATRNSIFFALRQTGLPVEPSSGGRTKWNRSRLGAPKGHALDAASVGALDVLCGWQIPLLLIKAVGRGAYQRTRLDRYGFPRGYLMRSKTMRGFRTGDLVRADVPTGPNAGVHVGRVAVRANGYFNVQTATGIAQSIAHRHCHLLSRGDGYSYAFAPPAEDSVASLVHQSTRERLLLPAFKVGVSAADR